MEFRKIKVEEFEKLKKLFPDNEKMWIKYKNKRLEQFERQEIDVFVIEDNEGFIGELTINYKNHQLETETIPNRRVYLEAFRVDKKYQGQSLGQKLINYCIDYLTNIGYTEFTIGVEDDNEIAKHIYFKLGFTEAIDYGHGNEFDQCEYTLYLKNVEIDKTIKKLMLECDLGIMQEIPKRVSGGLLNRMYKVTTDKGEFAIKTIKSRGNEKEKWIHNHTIAEKVANIAKEKGVKALPAKIINNSAIQKIDNYYFLIFKWFDGKAISDEELSIDKCKKVAKELAKLHKIDFSDIKKVCSAYYDLDEVDWDFYVEKIGNKELKELFKDNILHLKELNKKSIQAIKEISNNMVISHRDLDLPNVLWNEEDLVFIDWEATGLVNPVMELIDTAWNWSGGQKYFDIQKFKVFIQEYKENGGDISDFEKAIDANFEAKFGWLEYNIKRVCGIECIDDEERTLGEKEVARSIDEINKFDYYSLIMKNCKEEF